MLNRNGLNILLSLCLCFLSLSSSQSLFFFFFFYDNILKKQYDILFFVKITFIKVFFVVKSNIFLILMNGVLCRVLSFFCFFFLFVFVVFMLVDWMISVLDKTSGKTKYQNLKLKMLSLFLPLIFSMFLFVGCLFI